VRKRDVVGRTIVDVRQTRFWNPQTGTWEHDLECLTLDNGKHLYFQASETDVDYFVHGWVQ